MNNVGEAATNIWTEIVDRRYRFHLEREQAEVLRTVDRSAVLAAYRTLCSPRNENIRLLCVLVDGHAQMEHELLQDNEAIGLDAFLAQGRLKTIFIQNAAELQSVSELYDNFV